MTTCVILQSSYIPWRGVFDLIHQADVFVFLDRVQYTRRDWRSRNAVKTATGPVWLSVPVQATAHHQLLIADVQIKDGGHWARKHLRTIEQAYARAPHLAAVQSLLAPIYAAPPTHLHELNRILTRACWAMLSGGAAKLFVGDEDLALPPPASPTQRLITLCQAVGATRYLSGPSAKAYLDAEAFAKAKIELSFATYHYAPYPQLHGDFIPAVSVVDALMNLGPNSLSQVLAPPAEADFFLQRDAG